MTGGNERKGSKAAEKEARLAEQLKENLRRRKAVQTTRKPKAIKNREQH
ncbi:hypothetical protein [Minwuia sp.]